ncbi:hypothetical protein TCON_0218 [Astathelohania contejeani]|uniref:DEAD/DEAH box helicase n=1 Tax=Astathelohania contejeani TaxID=164912 RepID=A0ABQ7I2B3_9MICR|nr:hypothetical protein TCON_0218 [Thelohania contejeani]
MKSLKIENWFKTNIPTFIPASTHFSGMGTLLVHAGSILSHLDTLFLHKPTTKLYQQGFSFFLENFYNSKFTSITVYLDENINKFEISKEELEACINKYRFVSIYENEKDFVTFLADEKIGLAVGHDSPVGREFVYDCSRCNIYTALLNGMEIRWNIIFLFVYNPNKQNKSANKESNKSHITDSLVNKLTHLSINNKEIEICPSKQSELDLVIEKKRDNKPRNIQKYSQHLRKSAMSLFGGRLLYNPIGKVSGKQTNVPKMSSKQKKIIEENENKLEEERKRKENLFLKSFYNKYLQLDAEEKRRHLESVTSGSEEVMKMIILLKIEYYRDLWMLERRKEQVNEGVAIPCYLNCLLYIEKYAINNSKTNAGADKLKFVFQSLIDCRFEATAHELLEKYNLDIPGLKFSTKATSKPNELDLYLQLRYGGDKLKRSTDSRPDKRVLFEPDKWQRDLLDLVDQEQSAIISAPTSSGKTFICFYAIEKVLRESDEGVVIFCLPTKALVNQVAADVYARFTSKIYERTNMVLQGILMKDYQIDPFNCQVLITVPSMLETILVTGKIQNIKYIILDEVHKISSEEMGVHMERIIHLSSAPLLLLSATLGNLEGFFEWVQRVEKSKGRECKLITYDERYCELKPYIYRDRMIPINGFFIHNSNDITINADYNLLPEDLLNVYYAVYTVNKSFSKEIRPKSFFRSNIITKKDVKNYEKFIIGKLTKWVEEGAIDPRPIYDYLLDDYTDFNNTNENDNYMYNTITDLILNLRDNKLLPCIVFNTDRDICNKLAKTVYYQLEEMESKEEVDTNEKLVKEIMKEMKRTRDEKKTEESWKEDSIREEETIHLLKRERKNIKYCLFDVFDRLSDYELDEQISGVTKKRSVEKVYLDMLARGIGVHHNGMNKKYRELVEILFRTKHVTVVFSTETLSLGINMPCRTVVFAGDSIELDPLNYRQMAGRAGRRGFDTLGNVVFFGIPDNKIKNLMVSSVPNLSGIYSYINTSFLYKLEEEKKESINKKKDKKKTRAKKKEEDRKNENRMETYMSSILQNPLFLIGELNNFKYVVSLDSIEKRKELINKQILFLKEEEYVLEDGILSNISDVIIANKDTDPMIFAFLKVFRHVGVINNPVGFITLLSHFFAVKPVYNMGCVLPDLPKEVKVLCTRINQSYLNSYIDICSEELSTLQAEVKSPLILIDSFLHICEQNKNSYIVDFFCHGSPSVIQNVNGIGMGELFRGLGVVDGVLTSLIMLYEKYELDEEEKKMIGYIRGLFKNKYDTIFA